ncbi:MAG TPA: DUF2480 family protein [Balneolaceae bacterium]|nr:DUF2480 family protein [Balneolaceae bacterium]
MSKNQNDSFDPIKNKIKESSLVILDLESYKPQNTVAGFDIAPLLEKGLVAREDSFKANLEKIQWDDYTDQHVAVHCSTSAILPPWPFLMIANKLQPVARSVGFGDQESYQLELWENNIDSWDQEQFSGERIILKANKNVPHAIFLKAGYRLRSVVQTLMYGMPRNAVPIFKRKISN